MSFTPKTGPFPGSIGTVTIGTGDAAITLGGQNVLPFHTFDAPIRNTPKVGLEVSDRTDFLSVKGLAAFYAGCDTLPRRAAKAASCENTDFICLNLESADPAGENKSVADCVSDAVAAADAVTKPIVIMGCKNMEKDAALFAALADALKGRNVLLMSAKSEDYRTIGAAALHNGQKICAETADDINLAKQLNIMLRDMGAEPGSIVMNIGTAAVGYGYDYVASTLDRIRLAGLEQADADLQMPIIAPVSSDTWAVKESSASEEDEPQWGAQEERAIQMEIATAVSDLVCGADAVILRHPASAAAVKKFIAELV